MKRIEEKVVPENDDILKTMVRLILDGKSWIYLSVPLLRRLRIRCFYRHYSSTKSKYGLDVFEGILGVYSDGYMLVYLGPIWNKISSTSDPDVIYFLSKEKNNIKKRIAEKVIPEDADIVETIVQLAEENKSWIYLSNGLIERLEKNYLRDYFPCPGSVAGNNPEPERVIFYILDYDNTLSVDFRDTWHKVSDITISGKEGINIAGVEEEPEVIYFLS